MGERVNGAAQRGDIELFYCLIHENVKLLEEIEELPFVETPLHVAASAGDDSQHIQFAMEMMRLKPSFARKPDLNGDSPIHLALRKGHTQMVRRLLQVDGDLVRVKGTRGRTPLHDVAAAAKTNPELALMDTFLSYCPNSIEDVTIQNQTALHVALLENNDLGAFKRLVKWLRKNKPENAREILNRQDENGDTVLHVAVDKDQTEAVRVLLNCVVNLNVRNFNDQTAQDIWQEGNSSDIKDMLSYDGFLSCFSLPKVITCYENYPKVITCYENYRGKLGVLSKKFKNTVLFFGRLRIFREIILVFERMRIFRDKIVEGSRISNDDRNALLVVAALLMTITYQFVFSPPGGFTQGDQNPGQPSSNPPAPGVYYSNALPGTAIAERTMPHFQIVATISYITFTLSAIMTFLLLPSGYISALFKVALVQLWVSYYYSWGVIVNETAWVWRQCLYGTGLCFVLVLLAFFGRHFFGVRIKSLNLHLIFYVLYAFVLWRYVTKIPFEVAKY